MPCAFGVPGSTISGSGCVVEAQRRGREGGRIAPACLSVLVSAATYLAQPFGIGNEFVRDGTIHLPYASRQVEFLNPTWNLHCRSENPYIRRIPKQNGDTMRIAIERDVEQAVRGRTRA